MAHRKGYKHVFKRLHKGNLVSPVFYSSDFSLSNGTNRQLKVSTMEKIFSVLEVNKHNSESSAWVILNQNVYDISPFLHLHPGGKNILVQNLGTDISEVFSSSMIHKHSPKALKLLAQYKIGCVEGKRHLNTEEVVQDVIDIKKAVFTQVLELNPPQIYQKWIGEFPTASSIRIFESNFAEFFSRYSWWYIWPLWLPIILYLFWSEIGVIRLVNQFFAFLSGIWIWMMLEYIIHRFLFHLETETMLGNMYHLFAHGIHHITPLDATRLTFPPLFSVVIVSLFYAFFASLGFEGYKTLFAGGLLGFVLYDTVHYLLHHPSYLDNFNYFAARKSAHMHHHYINSNQNFGVTTSIFDIIFGTSSS